MSLKVLFLFYSIFKVNRYSLWNFKKCKSEMHLSCYDRKSWSTSVPVVSSLFEGYGGTNDMFVSIARNV